MEDRQLTCCFTGHRPEQIPPQHVDAIHWRLREQVERAVRDGYTHFISGMSRGIDLYAARIVLDIKEEHPSIRLEAASEMKKRLQAEAEDISQSALFLKVRSIVASELMLDEEEIGPDDHLVNDLGASSLDYFSVLTALAEEFSVPTPSDKEQYRYTLREFCNYIERYL